MTTRIRSKVQVSGYQTPRDRMWAAIRANANDFTLEVLERVARIKYNSANTYLQCLIRAGIVEKTHEEKRVPHWHKAHAGHFSLNHYKLVKDSGVEAPRVTTQGDRVTKGDHRLAIWTTLRIHVGTAFDADVLAALASSGGTEVSNVSARTYMKALWLAGYLELVTPGIQGRQKASYRLRRVMNTGPRAPQVHSAQRVFDPNLNAAMYQERPELDEERKEGTDPVDDRTPVCIAMVGPITTQEAAHDHLA